MQKSGSSSGLCRRQTIVRISKMDGWFTTPLPANAPRRSCEPSENGGNKMTNLPQYECPEDYRTEAYMRGKTEKPYDDFADEPEFDPN
jgi:hypothetical protein